MKNTSVKRYTTTPKLKEKVPPSGFVIRSIRQCVACALLFLICLPLSASDNPVRPYIARVLVASSDIKAVKLSIAELWDELCKRLPDYPQSDAWAEKVSEADISPSSDALSAESDTEASY